MVHRGKDRDWVDRATESRRRLVRRRVTVGTVVVVAILTATFLLYDGPRRSGLLDALGTTCGEFVVPKPADAPRGERVFTAWDEHMVDLSASFRDEAVAEEFTEFRDNVDRFATEHDLRPSLGTFRGWSPAGREFVAAANGELLVLGLTPTSWTLIEGLAVLDPGTGAAQGYAELSDPTRGEWQNPQRLLIGLGNWGDLAVLQTTTASGDTDVVVWDPVAGEKTECLRLKGAELNVDRLGAYPPTLIRVADLNSGLSAPGQMLIVHGREPVRYYGNAPEDLMLSTVDLEASKVTLIGEDLSQDDVIQLLRERSLHSGSGPEDTGRGEEEPPSEEADVLPSASLEEENLQPLGQEHFVLDWGAGYIIFERL
ncbi:hypothetical protein [Nesterenkonia rhizosphaerae]